MTDYTELKRLAEHHLSLGQAYTVAKPSVLLALIDENERIKARLCACRDCGGQGEIYSGHSSYQGHNQPPEPDMDVCGTCGGDGVLGPLEDFESLAAERDQLKAENEIFEEGMRSLASTLGAGGYNAATLTATQLVEKVQWGVDHLAETSGRQIDELRAEVAGLRTGYEAYERVNAELKAENEALRKRIDDMSPFKGAPLTGPDFKCLACGGYHYGLQGLPCPNMRITASAALGQGEQS
ncbi:hypothetical protein [Pseudomonas grimontii]|uniref:hypothetical protein n=1 Tax=Pseudomonas grimontii TaxID=129847 RepID=UPI00387B0DCD